MTDTGGGPNDTTAGSKISPSLRKRKADELSNDAGNNLPHLPAPVWGRVLDFMRYEEVRSALLVGKHIAVEAVKYVKALNITRESQMYIPAARRFMNVEEVNILCLLQGNGTFGVSGGEEYTISPGVVNRTMPLLLSFSKLQRSFLGGFLKNLLPGFENVRLRRDYSPVDCVGPENHEDVCLSLLNLFISASKTGALPNHLMLDGLLGCVQRIHPPNGPGRKTLKCEFCRDILTYFPLRTLVRKLPINREGPFCLSKHDTWSPVLHRPGIYEEMEEASEDALWNVLDKYSLYFWDYPSNYKRNDAAVERLMQRKGIKDGEKVFVWDFSVYEIEFMLSLGFNPAQISRDRLMGRLSNRIGWNNEEEEDLAIFNCWTKSALEELKKLGFPVDCKSIPLIDEFFE